MQQIFHHYSIFNLSLKKQNNEAEWMTDAGVPIVFLVGKEKKNQVKWEKKKLNHFFLQLSSAWAVSKKYELEPDRTALSGARIYLLQGEGTF